MYNDAPIAGAEVSFFATGAPRAATDITDAEGKFELVSVAALTNDTAGNTHTITGNLTLKGQAKSISFPAKVSISAEEVTAAGSVIINRLDWGINYKSLKGGASATDFAKWKGR